MPIALITGITGQDGSYLSETLLGKGYTVHGMVRRSSSLDRPRLLGQYNDPDIYGKKLFLHYADLSDTTSIRRIVANIQPDEFYHLAGQSHVGLSFEIPESTCELTAMGTLRPPDHATHRYERGRPGPWCPTQRPGRRRG